MVESQVLQHLVKENLSTNRAAGNLQSAERDSPKHGAWLSASLVTEEKDMEA
jgi:hypothetical protein